MQTIVYHNAGCRKWHGKALILACTDRASYVQCAQDGAEQGRNHVFKVGGPIPWSRLLYRTQYRWYTQFRALQSVT